MRKLIPIFFLLIWAQSARAQNFTTVTASNIQDVSGAKLASGMLCFDATNATNASNDTPSNEISFQAGGGGQVIRGPICTPITNGAIGTFQVPNSANTIPAGVAYHVYVVRGFYHVLDYYGVQVTGSTWSFDSYNPNSPTPAPPTGASVNGPLTVNGNLSVTGSLSLPSLQLGTPNTAGVRLNLGSLDANGLTWIGSNTGSVVSVSGVAATSLYVAGGNGIAHLAIDSSGNMGIQGVLNLGAPNSGGNRLFLGSYDANGLTWIGSNTGSVVSVSGVAATSLYVAGGNGIAHLAIDSSGNMGIQGALQLGTPLAVQYGGTGTSNPSLIAGTGISITGTWPNQTISATGGGGSATIIQTSAADTTWAGIASTTLVSTSQNTGGVWTINVWAEVTATGSGCTTGGTTTMSANISYTDSYTNSLVTKSSSTVLNLGTGNGTVGQNGSTSFIVYPKSGTAINYSTTVALNASCTTAPQYVIALQAIH